MGNLVGKRVVITRSPDHMEEFAQRLSACGAVPIRLALSRIIPVEDSEEMDSVIDSLSQFDMVVFSSRNAVRCFCDRVKDRDRLDQLFSRTIAAIGLKTARDVEAYGLRVSIVPEAAHAAEELGEAIVSKCDLRGKSVLFPRAVEGRRTLIDALEAQGANVRLLLVYRTVPETECKPLLQALLSGSEAVDWLTFASGSAVRFLAQLAGSDSFRLWVKQSRLPIAVIGRVTQEALKEFGLEATVMADPPNIETMIEVMDEYERKQRHG